MKRLLVALLAACMLFSGSAFAEKHTYTHNQNYNYNKDVDMVNAISGFLLGVGTLYTANTNPGAGSAGYYGQTYGGGVNGGGAYAPYYGANSLYNGYIFIAPPPQCIWIPYYNAYGQMMGYNPQCR